MERKGSPREQDIREEKEKERERHVPHYRMTHHLQTGAHERRKSRNHEILTCSTRFLLPVRSHSKARGDACHVTMSDAPGMDSTDTEAGASGAKDIVRGGREPYPHSSIVHPCDEQSACYKHYKRVSKLSAKSAAVFLFWGGYAGRVAMSEETSPGAPASLAASCSQLRTCR